MTGVEEGEKESNSQSSWRETRDSTHHASLSLSRSVLCRSHVSKTAEMG